MAEPSRYFRGNDPAAWRTGIPTYARVEYVDVYPGIDLVYYGNQQRLEYDFIVEPGVDPSKIRFAIERAGRVELASTGNILLHLGPGELQLERPVCYRDGENGRRPVACRYRSLGQRRFDFEIDAYDAERPLVIDPTSRRPPVYNLPTGVPPIVPFAGPVSLGIDAFDVQSPTFLEFSSRKAGFVFNLGSAMQINPIDIYGLDTCTGAITLELGWSAEGVAVPNIAALDRLPDGRIAFAVEARGWIHFAGGSMLAQPSIVYAYEPGSSVVGSLYDLGASGIPRIDGLHVLTDERVAFSTVRTFVAGPGGLLNVFDGDILVFDASDGSVRFLARSSELGITDLDGLTSEFGVPPDDWP